MSPRRPPGQPPKKRGRKPLGSAAKRGPHTVKLSPEAELAYEVEAARRGMSVRALVQETAERHAPVVPESCTESGNALPNGARNLSSPPD